MVCECIQDFLPFPTYVGKILLFLRVFFRTKIAPRVREVIFVLFTDPFFTQPKEVACE
eukprot:m.1664712 g.1664712  ORF g.1664712 m.1664712 type:complete len:58 (+) comp139914_c0_seq1:399-572(+)